MRKKLATAKTFRVLLPPEIDVTNAEQVCADLCVQVAVAAGTDTVIADMTVTRFCDSAGFRMLLVARDRLAATGVQLEVLVPAESPVMRAIKLIGQQPAVIPGSGADNPRPPGRQKPERSDADYRHVTD